MEKFMNFNLKVRLKNFIKKYDTFNRINLVESEKIVSLYNQMIKRQSRYIEFIISIKYY